MNSCMKVSVKIVRRSAGESNLSIHKGQIVTIQTNVMEVGHNPSASSNNSNG